MKRGIIPLCFCLSVFMSVFPQEKRNLSLLVLADEEFRQASTWQAEVAETLDKAGRDYEELFRLRLAISEFREWTADESLRSVDELAEDLGLKIDKGAADIVLAFTGRKNLDTRHSGSSLFKEGIIVLRRTAVRASMVKSLKHELAHLFAAVHVDDPGSLMDIFSRGQAFDARNKGLILLNRGRSFQGNRFFLPKENWEGTAALCREIAQANKVAGARESSQAQVSGKPPGVAAREKERRRDLDDVHLLLAQIYIEQERYSEAVDECGEGLAINPESMEALNFSGIALRRSGRVDEAIEKYEAILKMRPDHPQTLYNLGIAHSNKGELDKARECYERAVEVWPRFAEAHSNLGELYLRLGQDEKAEAAFRTALAINPRFALGYSNLAEVEFRRKDFDKALEMAEKALSLEPELPGPHNMKGKVYHKRGDLEGAKAEFQTALSINPKYEKAFYNLGNCWFDEKRFDEAKKMYAQAVELNPRFPEPHESLGTCWLLENKVDEAIQEFRLALELGLRSENLHLNLSSAYLRHKQADQAIDEATKALELNPSSAPAHNNLGIAYIQKAMGERAAQEFRVSLDLEPENKDALLNLGNLCLSQDKAEEALGLYLRLAAVDPANAAVHNNIAVIYYKRGDYAKSWEHVQKAEALGFKPHPGFLEELKKKIKS